MSTLLSKIRRIERFKSTDIGLKSAIVCFILLFATLTSYCQVFGLASDYNLFSRNGVRLTSSDVEGRIAAGGNSLLQTSYSVGIKMSENATRNDLIVDGTLTSGGIVMESGSIRHSGAFTNASGSIFYNFSGGQRVQGTSPINFSSVQTSLISLSDGWATLTATGTSAYTSITQTLTLTGTNSLVNIFNFPSGFNMGAVYNLRINVPSGSTIMINYGGTTVNFNSTAQMTFNTFYWNGSSYIQLPGVGGTVVSRELAQKIVWNFYDATTLNIENMGLKGSILAPNANLRAQNGHVDGNVIVNSMTADGINPSNLQINWFQFNGNIPCPSPPTAAGASRCGTGSVTFTASNCTGTYNWYNVASGGSSLGTAATYTTPSISVTTSYYVSCTVGTCTSSRDVAVATINAIPATPTATDGSRCGAGTVNVSASNCSGTYNWYNVATGGSSLSTAATYTTPSISATTSYYVSCTVGTCTSSRDVAVATINPIPAAPIAADGSRCGAGTVNVSASNCSGTYNWFNVATSGSSLSTAATYTTPSISATTSYYVSCTVGTCTSSRDVAVATINAIPATPIASDGSRCGAGTVNVSASNCSGTYNWFSAASGVGSSLSTAAIYTTPNISATTNYYVSCTVGTCISGRDVAVATINPIPPSPVVNSPVICQGESVNLSVTPTNGSTIIWQYGGITTSTPPTPNTSIPSINLYYVRQLSSAGCNSPSVLQTLTINAQPIAEVSKIDAQCLGYISINNAKLILNKFTSTETFAYGSPLATNPTFSAIPANGIIVSTLPNTTINYTVRIKNTYGCTIDRPITITVITCPCFSGSCESAIVTKIK